MAAQFTVNGINTTVKFEYTSLTKNMQDVINKVAESEYESETPFSDLTNQEKLNIVNDFIKKLLMFKAQEKVRQDEIVKAHKVDISDYVL